MKKNYFIIISFLWLFLFSFAMDASTLNSTKNRDNEPKMMMLKPAEVKSVFFVKDSKDTKEKESQTESSVSEKELLSYVADLQAELKQEENKNIEKIGELALTEGFTKMRTKLFTGKRKLLGKGEKDMLVTLILFQVKESSEEVTVLQELSREIGASKLFSAEIDLSQVGVNYLLIQVEKEDGQTESQLIQIIVEDIKTKDKLEKMTLKFLK